ncbi:HDOD domain-containing protein [Litorilituus lipolyticus]|uniref:HDOD domain-containing protein n=1 Tax=Litorilituus lipolyticus TaxID=2491017 RepID=A0A502KRA4_9GAMM|nr:HDOD domain-containing protein [Litorilituus lipolyticus]TPH14250.1 HDOD domain-containing protein [Litorilituus lipolyticus]
MIELDNEKMAGVVASYQVPVKPEILSEIQSLMDEDEPNIELIAQLISNDVGLSATILKIINSPFYGMNRRISEIKQAVMMLGLNTINGLVTAILLKSSFQGDACISLERFWDDALDVANAMTFIGNKIKSKIPVDMLYTIGLFHDCGIPLLALKFSNYKDILIEANSAGETSIALEEKNYSTNHAVLGYYVASSWHLPKDICQLILQHHDEKYLSTITGSQEQLAFAALKAAENMVERVKRFKLAPDWHQHSAQVLSVLGITEEDYTDLEEDYNDML